MIAFARGCSLFISSDRAACNNSVSLELPNGMMSVTTGSPEVIVPVLSNAAIVIFPACSRDVAVLKSIPFLALTPFPTIIATGVASPSAQGQLITRTATACIIAISAVAPVSSQTASVITEIKSTTGTKTPETLSAIFAIGAFVVPIFCFSVRYSFKIFSKSCFKISNPPNCKHTNS